MLQMPRHGTGVRGCHGRGGCHGGGGDTAGEGATGLVSGGATAGERPQGDTAGWRPSAGQGGRPWGANPTTQQFCPCGRPLGSVPAAGMQGAQPGCAAAGRPLHTARPAGSTWSSAAGDTAGWHFVRHPSWGQRCSPETTRVLLPERPSLENPFPVSAVLCPTSCRHLPCIQPSSRGGGRGRGPQGQTPERTCSWWHLLRQTPELQKRPGQHLGLKHSLS